MPGFLLCSLVSLIPFPSPCQHCQSLCDDSHEVLAFARAGNPPTRAPASCHRPETTGANFSHVSTRPTGRSGGVSPSVHAYYLKGGAEKNPSIMTRKAWPHSPRDETLRRSLNLATTHDSENSTVFSVTLASKHGRRAYAGHAAGVPPKSQKSEPGCLSASPQRYVMTCFHSRAATVQL
ncbi:uncharacterized protein B0I36DRAFT_392302 [Microdochium trichocladiopsis]|uniref:Secreted protein n=1 Tax=Microdochium trichocladiopsis TaxID=1682393 RepID=A0A9P8YGN4_9PEZI|nr:uncharacterized protein B0I36DRAFT_392302 [Microdochium trichocladiopsis]KAH7041372.1 hypothetical protein B0I36DRAFT_392302 [Microdochium trichocladiopsis]